MGHDASKLWDKHREVLVKLLSLSLCRAKLLEKKLKNELQSIYHALQMDSSDASIKAEEAIYQEHNLEAVALLIKNINILLARKHLLASSSVDEILPQIHTIIYCSNKLQVEELKEVYNVLVEIFGKRYCQGVLENKNAVDKELLEHMHPKVPDSLDLAKEIDKVLQMYKGHARPASPKADGGIKQNYNTGNKEYDEILHRVARLKSGTNV